MKFRSISIEEMKNNIFSFKDFPEVIGISSRWLIQKDGFYGLFKENKIIGICRVKFKKDICKIKLLEIKTNYQSQGNGSYILSKIEEIAKKKQCKEINLLPRDYRVYKFYENNGYKYIHEHLMKKLI